MADGTLSEARRVLDQPHHLSHPFERALFTGCAADTTLRRQDGGYWVFTWAIDPAQPGWELALRSRDPLPGSAEA
jgi:hypothetical protein